MEKERDYCLFIDCRKYDRNAACRRHDNAYGIHGGGGARERKNADLAFYTHMKAQHDPMAIPTYLACRIFGWFFFNYTQGPWTGQLAKRLCRWYRPGQHTTDA